MSLPVWLVHIFCPVASAKESCAASAQVLIHVRNIAKPNGNRQILQYLSEQMQKRKTQDESVDADAEQMETYCMDPVVFPFPLF